MSAAHASANTLQTLEPRGARYSLAELLRWRLAAPLLPLAARHTAIMSGGHRALQRGRGIDFEEVRPYQAGDDVRSIDWRVTARTSKPHTKVFREERERPVILLVDLRTPMFFGTRRCFKSAVAAHAAALIAWATLEAGDRIGALVLSDHGIIDIKPRRSHHTVLHLLQQLLNVQLLNVQNRHSSASPTAAQTVSAPTLRDAARQLHAVLHPGATAVLISDFHDWDDDCRAALARPARHAQCLAIQICDTLERALPPVGIARLWAGMRTALFDTGNAALTQRYQQQREAAQQQLQVQLQQLQMPLLSLNTETPLLPALRQFLTGRHHVASAVP